MRQVLIAVVASCLLVFSGNGQAHASMDRYLECKAQRNPHNQEISLKIYLDEAAGTAVLRVADSNPDVLSAEYLADDIFAREIGADGRLNISLTLNRETLRFKVIKSNMYANGACEIVLVNLNKRQI